MLCKHGVAGSNPTTSTNNGNRRTPVRWFFRIGKIRTRSISTGYEKIFGAMPQGGFRYLSGPAGASSDSAKRNPTTSTKTASEYLQGRFSYFICHSHACTCHHGGAQPPFLSSVQAAKWDSLEQLFLFTARCGSQVLDIQPVANIPLRKKRRGLYVNN